MLTHGWGLSKYICSWAGNYPFVTGLIPKTKKVTNVAMKEEGKTRTVRRHEKAIKVIQIVNAVVKYLELNYSNNQVSYMTSAAVLDY